MLSIRHFQPETDYPDLVKIGNAVYPEYPDTEKELRWQDSHRDPESKHARFMAEVDGQIVACAGYDQPGSLRKNNKFSIWVAVLPEEQGKGYGSTLYDYILEQLVPFDPTALRSGAREDKEKSLRFLAKRGFVEDMRYWESWLTVADFDFEKFAPVREKVAAQGIVIKTMTQLMEEDPEGFKRKLYDMVVVLQKDVPSPEPHVPTPYELWLNRFDSPNLIPDANFVALDGEHYVGFSNLWTSQSDDHMHTGLTGVRREYRRRGIALAMKLHAVEYARRIGSPVIRTGNEVNNRGMLSINEEFGFVKQPAWLDMGKTLKPDATETETTA